MGLARNTNNFVFSTGRIHGSVHQAIEADGLSLLQNPETDCFQKGRTATSQANWVIGLIPSLQNPEAVLSLK